MFILLDGPDRTGKTTLARNLIAHFSSETFLMLHTINIKNYTQDQYYRWYQTAFKTAIKSECSIILDRTHLSEYVFGSLSRGYDSSKIFNLEEIIADKNDVFLFLLSGKVEDLLEREDGCSIFSTKEAKMEEIKKFEEGFQKSSIRDRNKVFIDIEGKDTDTVFKIAKDTIETVLFNKSALYGRELLYRKELSYYNQ